MKWKYRSSLSVLNAELNLKVIFVEKTLSVSESNRKYKNRYWLVNDDVYELHFTQFYDDEIILKFIQDKDDSENYIYVSDLLNVENDEIQANSIEDAMEQFENMIVEHVNDEISYYENMLDKFNEGVD